MNVIEGAILIPLFCLMLFVAFDIGLDCYMEIAEQQEQERVEEIWEVNAFYIYKEVREIGDD